MLSKHPLLKATIAREKLTTLFRNVVDIKSHQVKQTFNVQITFCSVFTQHSFVYMLLI
jgi:hypothetical protein